MDVPVPTPGPDDIVVKTSMATVCGSDMHFVDEFANEMLAFAFPGPHVLPQGLLMGHEGVGVVHEVGANVKTLKPGDRVISSCLVGCGRCSECMTVDFSTCTGGGRVLFGCQAEYYLVPFADLNAARVPEGVSDEHAILATDIMSTGFGAIERAGARFGDSVAIFAQGPVGLCATAGARARGCGLIIAVDTVPERLEMSKKFGANVVINAKEEDPIAKIMSLTDNKGVHVAVEAVGTQATFEMCTRAVRRGGTVSSVGVYGLTPQLSMPTLTPSFLHRQIITTLCPSGRDRMEHLLSLLENGSVNLEPLFTHRMSLDQVPEAYDLFRSKQGGVLKIAIRP
jgi:threonine dehydrogenase-like Zn-dependent dehydrogenase